MNTLELADVIEKEKKSLLESWRNQVREIPAAKHQDDPTLNDHIPHLLGDLIDSLRVESSESIPEAVANLSGYSHGLQRLKEDYDIEEVVAEYNILRGCIHDLASRNNIVLQGAPFHILNRVLDGSIGQAVQTYATQQAEQVKKQREEYLSFVVHDLRTPLNAIAMAGQLLERKTLGKTEESSEFLNIIKVLQGNVRTLTTLITQILDENISLINQTGTKIEHRTFGLWGLIESVIQDLLPINETESFQLSNLIPFDVNVYGDAALLRRVFRNLIANSIKYTPKGSIEVGAMNRGEDGAVECWVTDTGSGIPQSRIGNIFEKLETDPSRDDGKGLGLSIVEAFIKAHGGEVTVESKVGVGTTFHIILPGKETKVEEEKKKIQS